MVWIKKSIQLTEEIQKELNWLVENGEYTPTESQIIRVAIRELYKQKRGET